MRLESNFGWMSKVIPRVLVAFGVWFTGVGDVAVAGEKGLVVGDFIITCNHWRMTKVRHLGMKPDMLWMAETGRVGENGYTSWLTVNGTVHVDPVGLSVVAGHTILAFACHDANPGFAILPVLGPTQSHATVVVFLNFHRSCKC